MIRILTSLVVIFSMGAVQAQAPSADIPKLVVGITVDQLRGDYLEHFKGALGQRGFNRLLSGGLVYQNMSFDFTPLNRASTLATIYTGTNPNFHSITDAQQYSVKNKQVSNIFQDDNFIGNYTQDKLSPIALKGSTIADELKIASNGVSDVFSFAPHAVQALITAGHNANSAYWVDDYSGKWASTTYYGDFYWTVDQDNRKSDSYTTKVWGSQWTPSVGVDLNNVFPYTKTVGTFSYDLGGDKETFPLSKCTPFINNNIRETATNLINKANLGKRGVPDFLSLTFYAGKYPKSDDYGAEVKDLYVQLDKDIEAILDAIDSAVGLQNTLVFLSSTGYAQTPEFDSRNESISKSGGVFYVDRCEALLNMYLMALYGQDQKWVSKYHNGHIYLNRELIKSKDLDLYKIQNMAAEFVSEFSGVQAVYTQHQLLLEHVPSEVQPFKNGVSKDNIGDLVIEIQPSYKITNEHDNTTNNKLVRSNAIYCPVIFYGNNIKAEKIRRTIKATEIAPSVTYRMRIRAPSGAKEYPLVELM